MAAHLIDRAGARDVALGRAQLAALRDGEGFFWLDVERPGGEELALLGEVFGFHPLALEDAIRFGQRPKLEDYGAFVFLVVYGHAPDEDNLVEVHCFYTERYLVTVRRDEAPAFTEVRERHARRPERLAEPLLVLHGVVDGLVDSFFPLLAALDDEIDEVEDAIAERPDEEQLRRIFALKRRIVQLRRVLAPEGDLAAEIARGTAELPGSSLEAERAFRDVYDHLLRLTDQLDSYRDLVTGVMDVYLSTVSNRLNAVMKQLTVIATVFLPITFVTGFFGQNFGWLVRAIGGEAQFFGIGIGLQLAAVAVLLAVFRRRGWI